MGNWDSQSPPFHVLRTNRTELKHPTSRSTAMNTKQQQIDALEKQLAELQAQIAAPAFYQQPAVTTAAVLDRLAAHCAAHLDCEAILAIARSRESEREH